jgi:dolichyl-diphosphooligosaccharide--protein glycosyltransferase
MLALLFCVALYFRLYLPYEQVFSNDWIKYTSIDAYYHMRLVDNLLHNFPHFLSFDPYTYFPYGTRVPWPPFFDWLLAGITWLVGLGSPSQHVVDIVGVSFPAMLGSLIVIPVYFLGRELFNWQVGLFSAGVIAVLPGEFLNRSTLGFTDHHVAETLFSSLFFLLLILTLKTAKQRGLSFSHIIQGNWPIITKPLAYSLLTGMMLAMYLLSWVGGLLLVLIISGYFVTQFIIDHLRGEKIEYLGITGALSLLTASILSFPATSRSLFQELYFPSFLIAFLIPVSLSGISWLMNSKQIRLIYYPLTLAGLGLAGIVAFRIINPDLFSSMVSTFRYFAPRIASFTIGEAAPLLFPAGEFSLAVVWNSFTTASFLSVIALGILIYLVVRQSSAERSLLVVWSLGMIAATLGQRRFAYYLAVNAALLTGYFTWLLFEFINMRLPLIALRRRARRKKRVKRPHSEGQMNTPKINRKRLTIALGAIAIFFLTFYPNIGVAITAVKYSSLRVPSDAWYASLDWLKENTPEPFGDPDFYYQIYNTPKPGEGFEYPESAYGIMNWWDYGHWITRISHRIPVSNPFQQGAEEAAAFFASHDESSANEIMESLGAKYVIINQDIATTKFDPIVIWAGRESIEFHEDYYLSKRGNLVQVIVFYPQYYHSQSVRLYTFDGKAVNPETTPVISYEIKAGPAGKSFKQITSVESFASYEDATAYVLADKTANRIIGGFDPFVSPIPLAELTHYRLIYSSDSPVTETSTSSEVKIFEYME